MAKAPPAKSVPAALRNDRLRTCDGQFGGGAEGFAAGRANAVGAMRQATDQFQGALQSVDAMEAVVAHVQRGSAVLAVVVSKLRRTP